MLDYPFFLENFLAYKNDFWTNVCSLQSSVLRNLASLTDMTCQHRFIILCFLRCDAFMFSVCSCSANYHGSGLLESTTHRWLWLMPCTVEQDTPIVGVVFPVSSHELLISTWILTLVELTRRSQAWRSRWLSSNEEELEPGEYTQHPNPQHGGWFLGLITIKISLSPEADPKSGLFTLSTSLTWIWDQPRKTPMQCCGGNALVIELIYILSVNDFKGKLG